MQELEVIEEASRITKIKEHIKEHKKIYIITTTGAIVCVAVGAIGMLQYLKKHGKAVSDEEIRKTEESYRWWIAAADRRIEEMLTSPYRDRTHSRYGNKVGRPGRKVIDTSTGREYDTIGLVARDMKYEYNKTRRAIENGEPINDRLFKFIDD